MPTTEVAKEPTSKESPSKKMESVKEQIDAVKTETPVVKEQQPAKEEQPSKDEQPSKEEPSSKEEQPSDELTKEAISQIMENMMSSVFPIQVEMPNGEKAEILISQVLQTIIFFFFFVISLFFLHPLMSYTQITHFLFSLSPSLSLSSLTHREMTSRVFVDTSRIIHWVSSGPLTHFILEILS